MSAPTHLWNQLRKSETLVSIINSYFDWFLDINKMALHINYSLMASL